MLQPNPLTLRSTLNFSSTEASSVAVLVTQSRSTLCNSMDCQVPLSMQFSRQEDWDQLPFLSPGDLPSPGMETGSPALHADSLPSEPQGKPNRSKGHNIISLLLVQAADNKSLEQWITVYLLNILAFGGPGLEASWQSTPFLFHSENTSQWRGFFFFKGENPLL